MKQAFVVVAVGAALLLPTTPASASAVFDNCSEAAAAGRFNIPASDPAYRKKLDRDGDGFACDRSGSGSPSDGEQTGGSTGTDSSLPKTGGNDTVRYGLAGGLLVSLGIPLMVYRRRTARHARP